MWEYDPKEADTTLPAGAYEAELLSAEPSISGNGKSMLTVTWRIIWDDRQHNLKDRIVRPATVFKLKKIAEALGADADFDAGIFDLETHLGAIVRLTLNVKNDKNFGDQNNVMAYDQASEIGRPPRQNGQEPPQGHRNDAPRADMPAGGELIPF